MKKIMLFTVCFLLLALIVETYQVRGQKSGGGANPMRAFDQEISHNDRRMMVEGRQTFRFDTFGDQAFWGNALKLHQAIAGAKLGGVGSGVSPRTALEVGLKVDVDALPQSLIRQLQAGQVNLDDPATTLALLKLNAVVGVTGFFDAQGGLRSMGIQCAFCHSTVDDSLLPGVGHRLDGWANRDLNVGAIIALAPDLSAAEQLLGVDEATVKTVLNSWGPGKFDAELFMDGKAFRPDGKSAATLIPPAFGLAGVNLHTWTGWGSVTHWNAFVANLEMHGVGTFYDPRLNNPEQFPVAAKAGFGNVRNDADLITSRLASLHFYQLAIPAPVPHEGSFNKEAAARGKDLFNSKARCSSCHVPPLFTEPGWNMHTAEEIGIDDFQANRAPDKRYRTTPLAGLWTHTKGGFYHDGRFATLKDVVAHYNRFMNLGLAEDAQNDLVEYLKSLPAPDKEREISELMAGKNVQPATLVGIVSDARCGRKHLRGDTAAECIHECIKQGANYALVVGDKVYELVGNTAALEKLAGEQARIRGTSNGRLVNVTTVEPVKKS